MEVYHSFLRGMFSVMEGYHSVLLRCTIKYCGRIPSVLLENTGSTVEGYHSVVKRMFSSVE